MTARRTRDHVERRLEDVRLALRQRHAGVEPDARFADRIVARLPRNEAWAFEWAVRRILPVSIALAAALTVVAVLTSGTASRTTVSASASSSQTASSQTANDPLEWLLESRQDVQ
jgi:hypothetical protein